MFCTKTFATATLINNIFITLLYQCMRREGEKDPVWSSWRRGIHYIIYYIYVALA
jgi:hypothetical protein